MQRKKGGEDQAVVSFLTSHPFFFLQIPSMFSFKSAEWCVKLTATFWHARAEKKNVFALIKVVNT